ncbi:MAG: indolepyruvate ferredoxin oxidoreductase subunit alpha [bacterium]
MKKLMSGNEAVARGAYEGGAGFATSYPGTPATEILEFCAQYPTIHSEWAVNEKTALEAAVGAALGGLRSIVSMKHVGLNAAADPFMTLPYIGVNAGLVIVSADDPEVFSSQNEQDNRRFAPLAKVPMLEPSDSQEAKDFTLAAFALSEEFDTPVLIRLTTRICHTRTTVHTDRPRPVRKRKFINDPPKRVMLPSNARVRHKILIEKIKQLRSYNETSAFNTMIWNDKKLGIITSGIAYQHARGAFPDASFLKLGMTFPLPEKLIRRFAAKVKKIIVIEELEPFLEEQIRALGIKVTGKDKLPRCGELNTDTIKDRLKATRRKKTGAQMRLPSRPPILCAGCPHRAFFHLIKGMNLTVFGDIGCYTLGFYPPLNLMDFDICMGAGVGASHGYEASGAAAERRAIAVIGDSTFTHSGITALLNHAYNQSTGTVVILDNHTTAMTGGQMHPGTGITLGGEKTRKLNYERLAHSMGIKRVFTINPYDQRASRKIIAREVTTSELSLIISSAPCPLFYRIKKPHSVIISSRCEMCGVCLKIGCPAISKENDDILIDPDQCRGCGLCIHKCSFGAIETSPAQ